MNQLYKIYMPIRTNRMLSLFVIWIRYLIGFAFVPSGLTKVLGQRFTVLPVSNPVGFFFEAMYQTGFYWNFLGLIQLLSAFLLMTQRFATLGNLLFLGIITNVYLITQAMHFQGTVYVTFMMLVASVGLLLWDLPKWHTLFFRDNFSTSIEMKGLPTYHSIWVTTGYVFFVESVLFGLMPRLFPDRYLTMMWGVFGLIVITAIIAFGLYLFRYRKK